MATAEHADATEVGAGAGLFTRKSSGLVRDIGLAHASAVSIAAISLGSIVVIFTSAVATFPHASLTVPIIVAGLLLIPTTLVYGQLAAAMPRSGGDYVYVGRIIHPALGAATGFALLITIAYGVGFTASWIGSIYGPPSLLALDGAFHIHTFASAATWISTKRGEFWVGVPAIVLACLVALRGARALSRAQLICVVIGMVPLVVMIVTFLVNGNGAFQAAFNKASAVPNGYQAMIHAARAGGWPIGVTAAGVIGVFPFAVGLYAGWQYVVYPAGEIKSAGRNTVRAMFIGLGVSFVVFLVAWLGFEHLVGLHFAQGASWLSSNNPTAASKITSQPLTPNGYALLVMGSGNGFWKILLAFLPVWVLAVEFEGMLIVSRILFALSFDRLLPRAVTRVGDRSHAPVVAIVFTFVLLVVALWAGINTGVGTALRNGALIALCIVVLSSVAAAVMPWVKRDVYAAAPKPFGEKWFGVPAVTVAGVISTAFFLTMLVLTATRPVLSGGYDAVSVTVLVCAGFGGLIAYGISTLYLRRKGTDLSLSMRELPPE